MKKRTKGLLLITVFLLLVSCLYIFSSLILMHCSLITNFLLLLLAWY